MYLARLSQLSITIHAFHVTSVIVVFVKNRMCVSHVKLTIVYTRTNAFNVRYKTAFLANNRVYVVLVHLAYSQIYLAKTV